ncbi:MAG TPA: alpha/beta hydrolase [Candidatus Acidoferrum sp.]|nr:alpha/beta hydrolase [Candidatus Acidoferrum sp.]
MEEDKRKNKEELPEEIEDDFDEDGETYGEEDGEIIDADWEEVEEDADEADDSEWEDDNFTPNFEDPYAVAKKREEAGKRKLVGVRMKDGTVVMKEDLPPWEELTEEQQEKRKRFRKRLLIFFLVLTLAELAWLGMRTNYHADEAALAAAATAEVVDGGLVFMPESEITAGVILYPGGQTQHKAYALLAKELSQQGCLVVIPKMTLNMAIFSPQAAEAYLNTYGDKTDNWYVGGHSVGGVAAAQYVSEYPAKVKGLILLASYSSQNISQLGVRVLSINATNDLVLDAARKTKYAGYLPADTTAVDIEGGNHSGFGSYGQQEGDGEPAISQTEQRAQIIEAVMAFVTK